MYAAPIPMTLPFYIVLYCTVLRSRHVYKATKSVQRVRLVFTQAQSLIGLDIAKRTD